MAETVVEDAPFSITLRPDHGETIFRLLHSFAGKVEFGGIKAEQDAGILWGEVFDLIDFVEEREAFRKASQAGEIGIFHNEGRIELTPGMSIEIAAEHFAVFGPGCKGDSSAVDADEAFTVVADEGEEISLLR